MSGPPFLSDVFVEFFVQANPMMGLFGFGEGMDFDSDKAYR